MLKRNCPKKIVLYALPLPLLLAILYGIPYGLFYLLINVIFVWLWGMAAKRKIGGVNGDVLGFSIEMGEIILLLAAQVLP